MQELKVAFFKYHHMTMNLKNIYNKIRKEKIDSIESVFKGWDKDSIYYSSKEKADSLLFAIDYWELLNGWTCLSIPKAIIGGEFR